MENINISEKSKSIVKQLFDLMEESRKEKEDNKMVILLFMKNFCPDFKSRLLEKSNEFFEKKMIKKKYRASTINSYVSNTYHKKENPSACNLDQILILIARDFIKDYIDHHERFAQNFNHLQPMIKIIDNASMDSKFKDTQIVIQKEDRKFIRKKTSEV
jgi:hypothetical protein